MSADDRIACSLRDVTEKMELLGQEFTDNDDDEIHVWVKTWLYRRQKQIVNQHLYFVIYVKHALRDDRTLRG